MLTCRWCNQPVDNRRASIDGDHLSLFDCREALQRRVRILEHELAELKKARAEAGLPNPADAQSVEAAATS